MERSQNTSPEQLQHDESIGDEASAYQLQENSSSSSQTQNINTEEKPFTLATESQESVFKDSSTDHSGAEESGASGSAPSHDCPICLQPCIHPARLPCGHIFCFLCIKGVAYKNQRCAMCRREIPAEFLERPHLVNGFEDICKSRCTDDGYQWFYEGRNGWWQYDVRTSQDIEDAHKNGEKSCTILVAGYVYIVDLEAMVQQRQNEPTRCRRVKRDLATVPKKGVAGLRIDSNAETLEAETLALTHSDSLGLLDDSGLVENVTENVAEAGSPSTSRQSYNFVPTPLTPELRRVSADTINRLQHSYDVNSSAITSVTRQRTLNPGTEISDSGAEGISHLASNIARNQTREPYAQPGAESVDNMLNDFQQMFIQNSSSSTEEANETHEQRGSRSRINRARP